MARIVAAAISQTSGVSWFARFVAFGVGVSLGLGVRVAVGLGVTVLRCTSSTPGPAVATSSGILVADSSVAIVACEAVLMLLCSSHPPPTNIITPILIISRRAERMVCFSLCGIILSETFYLSFYRSFRSRA
jgi:hypothetical protein